MAHAKPVSSANKLVVQQLDQQIESIEKVMDGDALTYFFDIEMGSEAIFRAAVESVKNRRKKLLVILQTGGGYIEVVERMVRVMRQHYERVEFIVPNYAMSAGTVLVMSGDEIHMDYYSILGPIDPQVHQRGRGHLIPALGYLEQFNRLIDKSKRGTLSVAEASFLIEKFDPAELYQYEQARELSVSLLEEWLVKYKFKNWLKTETRGKTVTAKMRRDRAVEIGRKLNDTKRWKVHGRGIPMRTLTEELKLKITDFSKNDKDNRAIKTYHKLLEDYMMTTGAEGAVHWKGSFSLLRGS
ncbi:MAG: hypothetical protein FLDDKLPJ_03243 [Phycisphaerae bacterium]|nr:hypothetical protein [Phycisphaerae bacterium]